jgi:signal transduction histidine kinase
VPGSSLVALADTVQYEQTILLLSGLAQTRIAMRERPSHLLAQPGSHRQRIQAVLAWLRDRLLPRGANALMIAAYTIILGALIMLIVAPPPLPAWRFYGTILVLASLLALNMALPDLEASFGSSRSDAMHLGLSAALVLLANWLGQPTAFSLLPFLLFMLASQAVVMLRFRHALLYSLLIVLGWLAIVWSWEPRLQFVANAGISLIPGMVFAMIFSIVVVRLTEQTYRAETLLRELQSANAELAAAREREKDLAVSEERVRLARDIHDGLGHHLTVLNVQLQAAAKLIERDPPRAAATIATCREVAQLALDEVRQSVAAMRRTPLDGRSLDEALRSLVADFDRHSPLAAGFEQQGAPVALAPAAAMTVYRAVQEGLTNAQKHGAAAHVVVNLAWTPAALRVVVADDGSSASTAGSGGFGLAGLRERAEQLGGSLHAAARSDGGFSLELELPLERNRDDPGAAR